MEEEFCEACEIAYSDEVTTEDGKGDGSWALNGRLKSWALWTAIVGLVSVIFSAFGLWNKIGITSDAFENVATAVGTVLTAFGILNNPTSTDSF